MFISNLIDSDFGTGKNYYPHVFLEEWKYLVKEKKIPKYIIDDIEVSSDSDQKNSGKENSSKKILMKKILAKKILMKEIENIFRKNLLNIYKNSK